MLGETKFELTEGKAKSDHKHGIIWGGRDSSTVAHRCPHCSQLMTQADYLRVQDLGVYVNESGTVHLHASGEFTDPDGNPVATPEHVAFHVWTVISPVVSWSTLVDEYLDAVSAFENNGDDSKLKTFTNTTLGECWEVATERTEAEELKNRAEPFQRGILPRECLLVLCGGDTQDNRVEFGVWGIGRGGQMWSIDHHVIFGNPELKETWDQAEQFLREQVYMDTNGVPHNIYATALDSGGHHTNAVYAFAHKLKALRVHAIKGASGREKAIDNGNTKVGYNWAGRIEKHGPTLWHVGTNLAKDRFHARMQVLTPGPGYVHLCKQMSDSWFKQLAGEQRFISRTAQGSETRWTPVSKSRAIEAKDCVTYVIWLEERLDLWHPRRNAFWAQLEEIANPPMDLFSQPPVAKVTNDQLPPQLREWSNKPADPDTLPRITLR